MWHVPAGARAVRYLFRRLPVGAADATPEVVHQADAGFALERAAFDVDLALGETVEIILILVFGSTGFTHAAALAAQRKKSEWDPGQVYERQFPNHRVFVQRGANSPQSG